MSLGLHELDLGRREGRSRPQELPVQRYRGRKSASQGHPRAYFVDTVLLVRAGKVAWGHRDDFHVAQPGYPLLSPVPPWSMTSELTCISHRGAAWRSWGETEGAICSLPHAGCLAD